MDLGDFLVVGNFSDVNKIDNFRLDYIKPEAELVTCFLSRGPYTHYINGIFECRDRVLFVKFALRHSWIFASINKKDQKNIDYFINCGYMLNNVTKQNKVDISGFEGISNKGDWFKKLCSNFREFIDQQGITICRDGFLDLSNFTGNEFGYNPS